MDDPVAWCIFAAFCGGLITMYVSSLNLALRHIAWVRLEEALTKRDRLDQLGWIRQHLDYIVTATSVTRLLVNVGIVLALTYPPLSSVASAEDGSPVAWRMKLFLCGLLALGLLCFCAYSIPQAWAKYAGTALLVRSVTFLRILWPLGWAMATPMRAVDVIVRRLTGASADEGNGKEEKQEELLNVVEEREKEGVVDEEERQMIESILELRDTTAGEIMTPRTDVIGIEVDTSFAEMIDLIRRTGHSRYPVFESSIDKIIGMIFAKDLLKQIGADKQPANIRSLMRDPKFVPEAKTLRDLLHDFQNTKSHFAVVLDEYGGTAGVITIEDILEELVGEITDEYEAPQAEPFNQVDENTYEIDARFHVDELNDKLNLGIPDDEDYETIGGFVFAQLGYIPQAGESFEHENLRFTVLDAEQRRINRLQLTIQFNVNSPE